MAMPGQPSRKARKGAYIAPPEVTKKFSSELLTLRTGTLGNRDRGRGHGRADPLRRLMGPLPPPLPLVATRCSLNTPRAWVFSKHTPGCAHLPARHAHLPRSIIITTRPEDPPPHGEGLDHGTANLPVDTAREGPPPPGEAANRGTANQTVATVPEDPPPLGEPLAAAPPTHRSLRYPKTIPAWGSRQQQHHRPTGRYGARISSPT